MLKVEVRPIRSFDQGDARVKDYCSIAPGQSVDMDPPLTTPRTVFGQDVVLDLLTRR